MSIPERMVMSQGATGGNQSRSKILVAGDSTSNVETLESLILDDGFAVYTGEWSAGAEDKAGLKPDLVIMDVGTPSPAASVRDRLLGYKSEWRVPVLCLLPLSEQFNARDVAELGADDYLIKPIRPIELSSRIRVLLQKSQRRASAPLIDRRRGPRRRADDRPVAPQRDHVRLVIDDASKSIILEGRRLRLSPKEYEIFRLLASQVGKVYGVEEIIRHVWRDGHRATASDVHQYIHLLRRKVEKDANRPRWIITVKGFGYKLEISTEP